jgi:hypothetical protein
MIILKIHAFIPREEAGVFRTPAISKRGGFEWENQIL